MLSCLTALSLYALFSAMLISLDMTVPNGKDDILIIFNIYTHS